MHENTTIRSESGPTFRFIGQFFLRILGWRAEGTVPSVPKYILVAAPHTSNMDLFYMLFTTMALRIPATWMMKDTAFWWPVGALWRKLGGVPINRRAATNVVQQIVNIFSSRDHLALLIAPEGTRKKVDHWKLGFYWMALEADVPVVPGYINHATRCTGVGAPIYLTGDIEADFRALQEFFEEKANVFPDFDKQQAERQMKRRRADGKGPVKAPQKTQ